MELKEDDTVSITSEMCRMSFEVARPSPDRLTSLDRKVIGYKIRTVSEPIYEALQESALLETENFRSPK